MPAGKESGTAFDRLKPVLLRQGQHRPCRTVLSLSYFSMGRNGRAEQYCDRSRYGAPHEQSHPQKSVLCGGLAGGFLDRDCFRQDCVGQPEEDLQMQVTPSANPSKSMACRGSRSAPMTARR